MDRTGGDTRGYWKNFCCHFGRRNCAPVAAAGPVSISVSVSVSGATLAARWLLAGELACHQRQVVFAASSRLSESAGDGAAFSPNSLLFPVTQTTPTAPRRASRPPGQLAGWLATRSPGYRDAIRSGVTHTVGAPASSSRPGWPRCARPNVGQTIDRWACWPAPPVARCRPARVGAAPASAGYPQLERKSKSKSKSNSNSNSKPESKRNRPLATLCGLGACPRAGPAKHN